MTKYGLLWPRCIDNTVIDKGTPIQYAAILAGLSEDYGCSSARLLTGTQLKKSDLKNINARVSATDLAILVENAYRITKVGALGIKLGSRINMSSHITFGYAIMNCSTFGEAIDFFLKYYRIITQRALITAGKIDEQCHATIKLKENFITPQYFTLETYFAALYTGARFLLQTHDLPFQLELAYPAPEHEKEYYRFFGPSVKFNCLQNSLSFPESLSKYTIESANTSLLAIYEQQCKGLLKKYRIRRKRKRKNLPITQHT